MTYPLILVNKNLEMCDVDFVTMCGLIELLLQILVVQDVLRGIKYITKSIESEIDGRVGHCRILMKSPCGMQGFFFYNIIMAPKIGTSYLLVGIFLIFTIDKRFNRISTPTIIVIRIFYINF